MVGTRFGHAQLLLRFPRKLCAYLGAKFGMVRMDQPHRRDWRNGMWGGNKTSSTLQDFCVNLRQQVWASILLQSFFDGSS